MLLRKGYKQKEVADMMGITERTVHNWRKRYEKGGVKALETKKKTRKKKKTLRGKFGKAGGNAETKRILDRQRGKEFDNDRI